MIRKPAVAGRFYSADPSELIASLQKHIPSSSQHQKAIGIIVPHAGYQYSGDVAGSTYASVELPRRFICLCPNHTGVGAQISLMSEGGWQTPLGTAEIDTGLAGEILQTCHLVQEDTLAHRDEHALEVQIPFLQHFLGNDFKFVPITVATGHYESLVALGKALAEAVRYTLEPVLLISSSDMNHFEPAERTLKKDQLAIERILELDRLGLFEAIHHHNISMCGYGPTIATMEAACQLGAREAKLVDHTHSGQITGEHASVVGYAGIVIH